MRILKYLGLALVFLYFFGGGVSHFTATAMFERIVPPYIPLPREVVYLTGVLELLGAIAICLPQWRRTAGLGLMALTVCVTPANVYMWMNPGLFPTMSPTLLFWRLPLQVLLLALIWWSTQAAGAATGNIRATMRGPRGSSA